MLSQISGMWSIASQEEQNACDTSQFQTVTTAEQGWYCIKCAKQLRLSCADVIIFCDVWDLTSIHQWDCWAEWCCECANSFPDCFWESIELLSLAKPLELTGPMEYQIFYCVFPDKGHEIILKWLRKEERMGIREERSALDVIFLWESVCSSNGSYWKILLKVTVWHDKQQQLPFFCMQSCTRKGNCQEGTFSAVKPRH